MTKLTRFFSEAFILGLEAVLLVQMILADDMVTRIIMGLVIIVSCGHQLYWLSKWRYRAMMEAFRNEGLIAAMHREGYDLVTTCAQCKQKVGDIAGHMQKVHDGQKHPG